MKHLPLPPASCPKEPIPIVVISAHAVEEVKNRLLGAGADQYITKPVTIDSLGEALKGIAARLQC